MTRTPGKERKECKEWNDDWIAHLYGELDADEEARLGRHLADCERCRETLDELSGARRVLQEAAPGVPAAPRLLVLRPRRFWQSGWAFAWGLACAALLFAAGIWAAPWIVPAAHPAAAHDAAGPAVANQDGVLTQADLDRALAAQRERFEARLAAFERGAGPGAPAEEVATWERVEDELHRVRNEMRQEQARDFRLLLGEINRNEVRTASWIDENRNVLRYALRNNPSVSDY
jgi:hypothetical protein